jgi:hypothetical protein
MQFSLISLMQGSVQSVIALQEPTCSVFFFVGETYMTLDDRLHNCITFWYILALDISWAQNEFTFWADYLFAFFFGLICSDSCSWSSHQ